MKNLILLPTILLLATVATAQDIGIHVPWRTPYDGLVSVMVYIPTSPNMSLAIDVEGPNGFSDTVTVTTDEDGFGIGYWTPIYFGLITYSWGPYSDIGRIVLP